ncbi:SRPBCC family protein [Paralimibaculum aggregatum]|uniref:SRPBCC family protein n=1 Tax=Paralimibaculum aggregatum TaxID=3036245 RepID=A0ABQ6LIV7_9RHOB|nr:SRPBCC domain-containing protein [Limibaculum sp. NKW23]GMG82361.1 SRPBCC family protein [Limibaculum sp. NKW23]
MTTETQTAAPTGTPPETPTEVTVSREIAAAPERVYALWLDPQAMIRWFGIDGITNTGCEVDPQVGGAWKLAATGPKGPFHVEGVFLALEPGRRVVQSWVHVDGDGTRGNETEAEVLFEPAGTGTRVTVHHRRIRFTPDAFREGWGQSLARIAELA